MVSVCYIILNFFTAQCRDGLGFKTAVSLCIYDFICDFALEFVFQNKYLVSVFMIVLQKRRTPL